MSSTKQDYTYGPDADTKALFKSLSQKKLKIIIEYLFSIKLPENCEIICVDTESNIVTGFEGKGYVKSDIIFEILNNGKESHPKIIIEFQTTPNKLMGYRLFIYSLNKSQMIEIDGEMYCEPAMCMTIYSTIGKPLYGVDKVRVKKYKYECTSLFKHKLIKTDEYYEFEYPFINILAMTKEDLDELDQLENNELDIFRVLYLYRYRKDNKLLLKEDFYEIAKKAQEVVQNYSGEDLDALLTVLQKLMRDIEDILNKKRYENLNYGKVLDNMEAQGFYKQLEINRKIRLEYEARGEARGEAKAEAKAAAKVAKAEAKVAKAEANCTAKIVKHLLETQSDEQVSNLLNMPLDYIKEIHLSM